MNNPAVHDIRRLAKVCVEAISKTLITESHDIVLPDFNLDRFQRELIDSRSRFVRVVAPAGSGKTRSLTAKAIHLVASTPQNRILALTFTNAAANELKARAQANGSGRGGLHVSTVNAFGYEVVKKMVPSHHLYTRGAPPFGGACNVVKKTLEQVSLGPGEFQQRYSEILDLADLTKSFGFFHTDSAEDVLTRFRALENLKMAPVLEMALRDLNLISSEPNLFDRAKPSEVFARTWFPFWRKLTENLWNATYISLEDQKYWALCLLAGEPRAQSWLEGQKLSHVMVDEFQDINYLDLYLIAQVVTFCKAALYIVGDDDQCIYEWRGCTSHFIREPDLHLGFLESTTQFKTIMLEQNYRCPRNVVQHAAKLISNNQARLQKTITAVRSDDANIRLVSLPAAYLTMHVVDELVAAITKSYPQHSVAILGRKKCQLIPLHILFTKRGTRFYVDKDLNVFLGNAFADFRGLLARKQIVETQTGTAQAVQGFFVLLNRLQKSRVNRKETEDIQRYLTARKPKSLRQCVELFAEYPGDFKKGYIEPRQAALRLQSYLDTTSVVQALHSASANFKGFARDFVKAREDIFYSDPPFSHLADLAVDYDDRFDAFVQDLDRTKQQAEAHSTRAGAKVELLTALRGKGREFDTVIMLDVNDGIWPSGQAVRNGFIEEERRLFYVAVSRTKSNLLLFESGRVQGKQLDPSPFLNEMELPPSARITHPEISTLSHALLATLNI